MFLTYNYITKHTKVMLLKKQYMYNGELHELVYVNIEDDVGIIKNLQQDYPSPDVRRTKVVMLSLEFILNELEQVHS